MKLIDKDTLAAEIESRIKSLEECFNGKFPMSQSVKETEQDKGKLVAYKSILSFSNSLEVKEVDLEKEYRDYINCDNGHTMFEIAVHFFELGMSVSNKAQKGGEV